MLENYEYVKEKMPNFRTNPNGRTKGTFTNFDSLDDKIDCLYYYMQYIKFGFGRATRDSCRMIQNNQMTREKAIELARKYDNEFPSKDFNEVLSFLDLNEVAVVKKNVMEVDAVNALIDLIKDNGDWVEPSSD